MAYAETYREGLVWIGGATKDGKKVFGSSPLETSYGAERNQLPTITGVHVEFASNLRTVKMLVAEEPVSDTELLGLVNVLRAFSGCHGCIVLMSRPCSRFLVRVESPNW